MALKNIDINCLIEVFDILNDTIAVLIANGAIEPFVKDSLNFAQHIQEAIEKNLDENEFDGIDDSENNQIKLTILSALNQNLACYQQKYKNDS